MSPAEFLPVAERTRLIIPLSTWVLHEACRQLAVWLARPGGQHLRIAVNISPGYLHNGLLQRDVEAALAAAGLPGNRLELELTESSLLLDPARANELLGPLQAQGVRLALDDFGTGYSSIRHLRDFQVSNLKLDRSFVRQICVDVLDRRLVTALTALGNELGTNWARVWWPREPKRWTPWPACARRGVTSCRATRWAALCQRTPPPEYCSMKE